VFSAFGAVVGYEVYMNYFNSFKKKSC